MEHTVGQVAALAGITVRTLHHYDEIGLVCPGGRTPAGYRRYDSADLERLQQVLFYRGLGFGLGEIAGVLDDPGRGSLPRLRRQHVLLSRRIGQLRQMLAALEREMEAYQMGINLTPEERIEVFGGFDPDEHAAEASRRWGDSDAYQESQRKAASYGKDDWAAIASEAAAVDAGYAAELNAGTAPDDPAAMAIAERHRQLISRWFYDCPPAIHRGLGEMYVADERFRSRYEAIAPGLAEFVRAATTANADRQEA